MKFTSYLSLAVCLTATVNGLPAKPWAKSRNTLTIRQTNDTAAANVNVSTQSADAPIFVALGSSHYLSMPALYVGGMLKDGKWTRYNANAADLGRETGMAAAEDRIVGDNSQASCVTIMLISKTGVIYAHIPPYLCPFMKNYKGTLKKDATKVKEHDQLQSAVRRIFKDYKSQLGKFVAYVIIEQNLRRDEVQQNMEELFGEKIFGGTRIQIDHEPNHLTNLVLMDLTTDPPKLTIKGQRQMLQIPN